MLSFEEAQKKWLAEIFPDREIIEVNWEPPSIRKDYDTFGSRDFTEEGHLEIRFEDSWVFENKYISYEEYLYNILKAGIE